MIQGNEESVREIERSPKPVSCHMNRPSPHPPVPLSLSLTSVSKHTSGPAIAESIVSLLSLAAWDSLSLVSQLLGDEGSSFRCPAIELLFRELDIATLEEAKLRPVCLHTAVRDCVPGEEE